MVKVKIIIIQVSRIQTLLNKTLSIIIYKNTSVPDRTADPDPSVHVNE